MANWGVSEVNLLDTRIDKGDKFGVEIKAYNNTTSTQKIVCSFREGKYHPITIFAFYVKPSSTRTYTTNIDSSEIYFSPTDKEKDTVDKEIWMANTAKENNPLYYAGTLTINMPQPTPTPPPSPPPADFSFSNLRITRDGEIIKPKVDVTNIGGQSGSILVKFLLDGNEVTNTGTVTIGAGNTKTLSGAFIPTDKEGGRICAVEQDGDARLCNTFSWGKIIKPLRTTNISFPTEVGMDESFDVSCEVVNDGAISKDGTVELTINDNVRNTKTVSAVPPNDSKHVYFTTSISSRGSHEICCDVTKTNYSI